MGCYIYTPGQARKCRIKILFNVLSSKYKEIWVILSIGWNCFQRKYLFASDNMKSTTKPSIEFLFSRPEVFFIVGHYTKHAPLCFCEFRSKHLSKTSRSCSLHWTSCASPPLVNCHTLRRSCKYAVVVFNGLKLNSKSKKIIKISAANSGARPLDWSTLNILTKRLFHSCYATTIN